MESIHRNLCDAGDYVVRYPTTMPEANGHPADSEHACCTTLSCGRHYQIVVQCKRCGVVYTKLRRSPGDILGDYEAVVDTRYLTEREARVLTFGYHIRSLEDMIPTYNGYRLLDIGAYVGVFADVTQQRGRDAWGLETSRWAAQEGRKQGLNMIRGMLRYVELDSESFDGVTMWDVETHLSFFARYVGSHGRKGRACA